MKGIDVSHWNSIEDLWKHIDPKFIIAKLTEGKSKVDYTAFTYYMYATAMKMSFGVYHFCHPVKNTPQTEVNHFLKNYRKLNNDKIMVALDVEADALTLNSGALDDWCYEWLQLVSDFVDNKVMIYMSQSQCKRFDKCKNFDLWVARYRDENLGHGDVTPWEKPYIWQYDSKGVDKNIMYI